MTRDEIMVMGQQLSYIRNQIASHPEQTPELRILKIGEEYGEVVQALIGMKSANKRKGKTHTEIDVAIELADVAITSIVALYDYLEFPVEFLADQIALVHSRVRIEGS